jgi:peptidoglycan/LPS O-acetylase OafA/YrhL
MSKISSNYRPDIDGLRGIAVSCVVLFHAGLAGFGGGFVGVDIFFVISGYLICSIIQREIEEQRFSYAKFYARRAKRILPALFAVLLACFVAATLVMTAAEMKDFSKSAVANIGAFSNIYFWYSSNYFSTASELKPLMMTWSLSVEEQFYLFFPPLLLLIQRYRWRTGVALAVLAALSLLASVWVTARYPASAFFLLPTRAWELAVGALLAHHDSRAALRRFVLPRWAKETLGGLGLLGLAAAIVGFDHNTAFPGIAAAVPVFATAMLIAAQGSAVNRFILGNKALVFVGLVSYSWYLWHWPLLSFARLVADHPISLATALTLVALSFLLAIASWRFVEQPFRTTSASDSTSLWRYGAATALMLTIGAVLVAGRGWEKRLPDEFIAIERSGAIRFDPCLAAYGQAAPNLERGCVAAAGGNTVALIGDSHAAALSAGLRTLATRHGLGYTQLTKASCPALSGVTRLMLNHPQHERECAAFNQAALARLRDDPNIKVVFFAGYWSAPFADEHAGQRFVPDHWSGADVTPEQSRHYLRQGMAATVEFLSAAGKTVVLLKDVPMFNFDPVRAVATESIPMRKRLAAALDVLPAGDGRTAADTQLTNRNDPSHGYIDAIGKQYPHVVIIDPAAALCAHGRCSYSGASDLYYVDFQHLSEAGALAMLNQAAVTGLFAHQPGAAMASAPVAARP